MNATSARRQGHTGRPEGLAKRSENGAGREVEATGGQRALLNDHRRRLHLVVGTRKPGKSFCERPQSCSAAGGDCSVAGRGTAAADPESVV